MMSRTPKSTRTSGAIALWIVILLGAVVSIEASDPPHWYSQLNTIGCNDGCHVPHQATGGTLTPAAGNVNLCQSCHRAGGLAEDLSIDSTDKSTPHQRGTSHAFDTCVTNPSAGSQPPLDTEMSLRVMAPDGPCPDGYVVCSTCHDQHNASSSFGGSSRVGNAQMITANGSPDGLIASGTFIGPDGLWYLIEIAVDGDQNNARFGFSKDNGVTWNPNNCEPGTGTTSGCLTADGLNPVGLDFGVAVSFGAGSYVAGDRWEFAASWPFLRAKLDDAGAGSVMCRDCHRDWDLTAVDSWNSGGVKSHPVRVAYPAPGTEGYYDDGPRDGSGVDQGTGDGNPTNDLLFDGNSEVQCLSCHGVHFVDSNTETMDGPP